MKKISYLGLLSLLLIGCNGNTSSTVSSSHSSLSTSSVVSSTSSLGPVSYDLTDEMIEELEYGYSVDGLYMSTVKNQVVSTYYYSYNCTPTVYEYTAYQDVLENPKKDKVMESYRYEAFDYGDGTEYLTLVKLNLANECVNYPVTDGYGTFLTWSSTGFGNIFSSLNSSYFEKGENEFEFDLKMNLIGKNSIYAALTSQFSSYMGLTAKSFQLKTDGYKVVGYRMDYEPLYTTSGAMDIYVEGTFTNFGEDVITPVLP